MNVLVPYPNSLLGAWLQNHAPEGITPMTVNADFRDPDQVREVLKRVQPEAAIIETPFCGGIAWNQTHPADLIRDNLAVQTALIPALFKRGVSRLVFMGSSCMYPCGLERPMAEDDLETGPLEATNHAYASAKLAGSAMCRAYNAQHGVQYLTLIPANLYGPHDDFDPQSAHVIAALLARFHHAVQTGAASVVVWGSGKPVRDFLFVGDLADVLGRLLTGPAPEHQVLNLGSGRGYTIAELAESAAAVTGFQGRIEYDINRPDGMPIKILDGRRADALGLRPTTRLIDGLRQTYAWYKEHIATGEKP